MDLDYGSEKLSAEETAKVIEIGREVGLEWRFSAHNKSLRLAFDDAQQEELWDELTKYARTILEEKLPEDVELKEVEIITHFSNVEFDFYRTGEEIMQMGFASARAVIPGMEPSIAVAQLSKVLDSYKLRIFSFDEREQAYGDNLPQLQEYADRLKFRMSNPDSYDLFNLSCDY